MQMSTKGDVPITILVIGVFAICVLTIFSFMLSSNRINNGMGCVGLQETVYSIQEELEFKESKGVETFSEYQMEKVLVVIGDNIITGYAYQRNIIKKLEKDKLLCSVEYRH
jgi:hypothetical protein